MEALDHFSQVIWLIANFDKSNIFSHIMVHIRCLTIIKSVLLDMDRGSITT